MNRKLSRAVWLLPLAVCIVLVVLGAPAIMVAALVIASSLVAGFSSGMFQGLARRRLFAVLLGGVLGVTGLYFGVLLLMVVADGFTHFDPGVMSHWAELFFLPLFVLGSFPAGFQAVIVFGSALVGVAVIGASRPERVV